MTEAEITKKLKELKQIKPRKDWVSLTKKDLLGEESFGLTLFPYFKPAFAGLIAVFMVFGLFGFVKNSLPGDLLYIVRKAAHEGQALFVSEEEKPVYQLKLANDRLEDLIAKAPVRNLASTINEFQANIHQAAENLAKIDATTSDAMVMRQIVEETKKIDENKQKAESLGMVVGGTEELNSVLAKIIGNLIEDLEERTFNEEKEEVLAGMKELFDEGKYIESLELYLTNQ